jgi:hypothetical protein
MYFFNVAPFQRPEYLSGVSAFAPPICRECVSILLTVDRYAPCCRVFKQHCCHFESLADVFPCYVISNALVVIRGEESSTCSAIFPYVQCPACQCLDQGFEYTYSFPSVLLVIQLEGCALCCHHQGGWSVMW